MYSQGCTEESLRVSDVEESDEDETLEESEPLLSNSMEVLPSEVRSRTTSGATEGHSTEG